MTTKIDYDYWLQRYNKIQNGLIKEGNKCITIGEKNLHIIIKKILDRDIKLYEEMLLWWDIANEGTLVEYLDNPDDTFYILGEEDAYNDGINQKRYACTIILLKILHMNG